MRALSRPDALAGMVFILLGGGFLAISAGYHGGSASEMGPGYFPRLLSLLLIALGLAQVLRTLFSAGGAGGEERPAFHFRPAVFVLGSMAVFALTLQSLGLILASTLLVLTAGTVAPGRRWAEVVIGSLVLAGFCAVVFVKALGVVMPLWPGFI